MSVIGYMSVIEQVKNLSAIQSENDAQGEYFRSLEQALDIYHELVASGRLKPRENKVEAGYHIYPVSSNF